MSEVLITNKIIVDQQWINFMVRRILNYLQLQFNKPDNIFLIAPVHSSF